MTFQSKPHAEIEDYGLARVRDMAFDAVMKLWRKRQREGLTQKDVAERLDRNPAWVSRQLSGPGNWTLRTFGALVEALDGEAEISVMPIELPMDVPNNYDAYAVAGQSNMQASPWQAINQPVSQSGSFAFAYAVPGTAS